MKNLLATIVFLGSSAAMACMPAGDPLNQEGKNSFARDLRRSNTRCFAEIQGKIGNIITREVTVIENVQDGFIQYSVRGNGMQIQIIKTPWHGEVMRYQCGHVTHITRGC